MLRASLGCARPPRAGDTGPGRLAPASRPRRRPPNFPGNGASPAPRGSTRRHNFPSPLDAERGGGGRSQGRAHTHLPRGAAALKFPAAPLCGGRPLLPLSPIPPHPPRGAPAPGPSPRPPAGPGSGKPLAPGDGARPTPARRRPRGHLRAGARPGYLSPRPRAAGVLWRLSRRLSARPRAARPARYSMPGGARAGGAHWTRGEGDAVPWQLRAGNPRLPGVRAGRVRPRTSGRLLSPRPPTSGGSPRARRGALIRSR